MNDKMDELLSMLQEVIDGTMADNKHEPDFGTRRYGEGFCAGIELAQRYIKNACRPICPRCGKTITGHPAISRTDNHTEICSDCGIAEALEAFMAQEGK